MKRRDFAKTMAGAMAGIALGSQRGWATVLAPGLSNPADQPKFANPVPDALKPGFIYQPDRRGRYKIQIGPAVHQTGLVDSGMNPLSTPVWGYGSQMDRIFTWPGRTFQIQSGPGQTEVIWANALDGVAQHLLPVDTSLHWCYSLPGYTRYSIARNGVPIITHLHGGHTDYQFDGNPEYFYGPPMRRRQVVGPQWDNVPGGFTTKFRYDNNVPAGNLWYHDHALGITRLNVYAGMAGFYFVRDGDDTGLPGNSYGLPAWPYEKAYAIQDRMFLSTGELFYPAFPGDPFYDEFITDADDPPVILPEFMFPGGGPTALAEFFGDHMVVNGMIWPKEDVEPRNYRLHLLNGCDSRFLVIRLRVAPAGATELAGGYPTIPFHVVGSDQGLASSATQVDTLVVEPGGRYDIVVDFKGLQGYRIIMENVGGDAPFGGEYGDPEDNFTQRQTDRIMAFDVANSQDVLDAFNPGTFAGPSHVNDNGVTRTRRVALFEGNDEYGRLQPLLGVAEPTMDAQGNMVNGALAWHQPTTENPGVGDTEIWEIYNATGDAHPVHLHLVHFEILDRQDFTYDLVEKVVPQHNGAEGTGYYLSNIQTQGPRVPIGDSDYAEYVENAPKDMVTALPGQITRIKATFDKAGRYVWHCHILSHEDHEMMRVLHVGPGA
jgi:FtsP/CotA-like multicopper oxidase with cupredoxin domain